MMNALAGSRPQVVEDGRCRADPNAQADIRITALGGEGTAMAGIWGAYMVAAALQLSASGRLVEERTIGILMRGAPGPWPDPVSASDPLEHGLRGNGVLGDEVLHPLDVLHGVRATGVMLRTVTPAST